MESPQKVDFLKGQDPYSCFHRTLRVVICLRVEGVKDPTGIDTRWYIPKEFLFYDNENYGFNISQRKVMHFGRNQAKRNVLNVFCE